MKARGAKRQAEHQAKHQAKHQAGKAPPRRNPGGDGRSRRRTRTRWRPEVVPKAGPRRSGEADTDRALAARIKRIRRALYDLYGDLEYFKSSPTEHRERLRQGLDWPDVGHITSLLRSLAEEGRFTDWLRFNGMLHGSAFVGTAAREKIA